MPDIEYCLFIIVADIDFVSLPSASEGGNLVFKLVVNHPDDSQSLKLMFLAASSEDKASWASDISQVHFLVTEKARQHLFIFLRPVFRKQIVNKCLAAADLNNIILLFFTVY